MKRIAVALAVLLAITFLFPLVLTISASFKGREEALHAPLRVVPYTPTLNNYRLIFNYKPVYGYDFGRHVYPIGRWLYNSTVTAVAGSVTTTATALLMAFALAKYRFTGRRVIIALLVLSIVIPGQVTFVQRFVVVRHIGLYNTLWAIIVPNFISVGSVWFLMQYMKSIPNELVDMGRIDGLGAWGLVRRVIAPSSSPAIAALMAMHLVGAWQEYMWPLVVLRKKELYMLAVGVREVIVMDSIINTTDANPGIGFAGAVIGMLPGLVLFAAFQRYFVSGLFAKSGGK